MQNVKKEHVTACIGLEQTVTRKINMATNSTATNYSPG